MDMIRSFRDKALERFFATGDGRRQRAEYATNSQHSASARRRLTARGYEFAGIPLSCTRWPRQRPLCGHRQRKLAHYIWLDRRRCYRRRSGRLSLRNRFMTRKLPKRGLLPMHPGELLREYILPALDWFTSKST